MLIIIGLTGCGGEKQSEAPPPRRPVRVAVIANLISSGLWNEISARFTESTGWPVEVVFTGEREDVAAALRAGKCDLATLHDGEITNALIADLCGMNMRPWTISEMVIVGPRTDTAGIRGLKDGAEALRRIAQTQSWYVEPPGTGSREMAQVLWKKAGVEPKGTWVLRDERGGDGGGGGGQGGGHGGGKGGGLGFAAKHSAYAISGRISAERQTAAADSALEILVSGDPAMTRPFVVIEANPSQFPDANAAGASALSDYLVSPEAQNLLREFGRSASSGQAWFSPLPGKRAAEPLSFLPPRGIKPSGGASPGQARQ